MNAPSAVNSVAETIAEQAAALTPDKIPAAVRARAEELLIDVAGLCVAARSTDYMRALIAGVDGGGQCSALGHAGGFNAVSYTHLRAHETRHDLVCRLLL